MFKNIFLIIILSFFSSFSFAEPVLKDMTTEFKLPEAMKNCSIYYLKNDGFIPRSLYVTHCPNAKAETVRNGKHPVRVISTDINSSVTESSVIDLNGDKYIPFDSVSNIDFNKVIELNGKKYVKLK